MLDSVAYRRLSELAEIIPGYKQISHGWPTDPSRKRYLLISARNINEGKLVDAGTEPHVEEKNTEVFRRSIARPGDIIICARNYTGKLYFYTEDDPPCVVDSSCKIIRPAEGNGYLGSYLRSFEGGRDFQEKVAKATKGRFSPKLDLANLSSINIPVFNIHDLERLADARIERSSKAELEALKKELDSKGGEIARLCAEKDEIEAFYKNRLRTIEAQIRTTDLASMIKHGETPSLEFKSSLRWSLEGNVVDKRVENAALKTIVAFCNTKGGDLLIGVSKDNTIIGVQNDRLSSADEFLRHLGSLLRQRIVPNVAHLIQYSMVTLDGKEVCHVTCKPSKRDIWLKSDRSSPERFFIRDGTSSIELSPMEAVAYIREHFTTPKED